MKERLQASTTYPIPFLLLSNVDHSTPVYGASVTVGLSKNGGLFAAASGTITELNIAVPSSLSTSGASSTGGHLAQSTTYYYKVTATNVLGETSPSSELSYSVPASGTATNQITVNWGAVTGATGYKIYRSTTSGNELYLDSVSGVTSYADTTNNTPAGALPSSNSTSGGWYTLSGSGLATDLDTLGPLVVHAMATGADLCDSLFTVVSYDPFAAIITSGTGTGQLSTSSGAVTVGTNNDKTGYSLNLAQAIPTSNTAQTVGDALNAARAQGFGKWVLSGTTLTIYANDGSTVVHEFTLDSATAPTQRA